MIRIGEEPAMHNQKSRRKILIGMIEVAGQYRNLSCGLTAIGVEHDFITYSNSAFEYGGETKSPPILEASKKLRMRLDHTSPKHIRIFYKFLIGVMQSIWAIGAIFRYNIFIFGFGSSLLPYNLDLPILRFLKKRVISNIGHGSEARPPYLNGKWTTNRPIDQRFLKYLIRSSQKISRKVNFIQKYSNITVGAPFSSSLFTNGLMINRLALGRPVSPAAAPESSRELLIDYNAEAPKECRPTRIIHCPSDRATKGTEEIIAAVNRLRNKGHSIDFRILEGVPNADVLAEISMCDFVIDQLYSDLPMPAISTEAAMYGKPSIVGGYDLDALRDSVPDDMWPPVYISKPNNIESSIEDLIVNKKKREDIGKKLFEFVNSNWSAEFYAKRYMRLVDGDIPQDWWFDPKAVDYFHGCGQSMETTRNIISSLVSFGGINCLQLRRNEVLERNTWLDLS